MIQMPTLSKAQFETLDDTALTWACQQPVERAIQGRSPQVKRAAYEEVSPSRRALYMFCVVFGHAEHGVLNFLTKFDYLLHTPDSWRAFKDGFAYFGAEPMVRVITAMEELFHRIKALGPGAEELPEIVAAASELDRQLTAPLDDALHLVAGFIRGHALEFAVLQA